VSGDGDWGIVNTAPKPGWLSWAPDWLWAYDYPNNVLGRVLTEPVFPTPIYETTMAVMIFGLLWFLRKRLPYWGQLFGIYLVLNGLERFFIEKIRVNNTVATLGGMEITQAEIISSLMFIAGLVFLYLTTFVWKKNQKSEVRGQKPEGGDLHE
jgi:prolipoprotein diacylglyceryltransferase